MSPDPKPDYTASKTNEYTEATESTSDEEAFDTDTIKQTERGTQITAETIYTTEEFEQTTEVTEQTNVQTEQTTEDVSVEITENNTQAASSVESESELSESVVYESATTEITDDEDASIESGESLDDNYIVISKNTSKMHRPSCSYAKNILSKNKLISYLSPEKLLTTYAPCKFCMPELVTSEDSEISVESESEIETEVADGTGNVDETESFETTEYIVNISTEKFHLPSCYTVKSMRDDNKKVVNATYEDMIAQGYIPCKTCKPK